MKNTKDIIKIENNEVKAIIENPFVQVFANRNGEFMIGEIYGKAYEDKIVYIRDGDRNKLEYAKTLNKSDLKNGIVIDKFNFQTLITRNGCPNYQDVYRTDGRFRVNYIMGYLIGVNPNNNYRYTSVWIFLKGQRKNWLGNWKDYDAELKWMECAWEVVDNWGRTYTRVEHTKQSVGGKVKSIYEIHHLYDYTPPSQFTNHYFEYNKGKGTSNYLDWIKYAVHCCGIPNSDCPAADG